MLNGSQKLVYCTLLTSVKTKTKNEKQKSVSSDWLGKGRRSLSRQKCGVLRTADNGRTNPVWVMAKLFISHLIKLRELGEKSFLCHGQC